jgi:hypothetical protein
MKGSTQGSKKREVILTLLFENQEDTIIELL